MTNPFKVGDILYRYYDNWGEPEPRLTEWRVVKLTQCCVWLQEKEDYDLLEGVAFGMVDEWKPQLRRMDWGVHRPFAHKTKKAAMESWKKRKIKHFQYVKADYHHLLAIVNKYDLCDEKTVEFNPLELLSEGSC